MPDQAALDQVDVLDHPIRDNLAREVSNDLVDINDDASGLVDGEASRLDVRVGSHAEAREGSARRLAREAALIVGGKLQARMAIVATSSLAVILLITALLRWVVSLLQGSKSGKRREGDLCTA